MEVGGDGGARVPAVGPAQQKLIESFCGITSSVPEEAAFFLECHNWQLDAAIHSFYDGDGEGGDGDGNGHPVPRPRRPAPDDDADADVDDDEDDEDYVPARGEASPPAGMERDREEEEEGGRRRRKKKKKRGEGSSGGRIRTLADLDEEEGNGSEDDDEDKGQEYYTGGEKSGMLVRDPARRGNNVDEIFEQARQMGAQQVPIENARPSGSRSFAGIGRLLSGESAPAAPQPQQPENITRNITFWTNGFSIDDGPLRRFDDPANMSFLESIRRSECPKELEPSDMRSTVQVSLTRKEENYPEPVRRRVPFKGVGRTLGSGSTDDTKPEEPEPPVPCAGASRIPSSFAGLTVDDTMPSASIQLRLADGTRMVARFNTHHTVGDIRAFIDASRPGYTGDYLLQTVGFPPKQLKDSSQTVEQADLANSVVIQRLC